MCYKAWNSREVITYHSPVHTPHSLRESLRFTDSCVLNLKAKKAGEICVKFMLVMLSVCTCFCVARFFLPFR